VNEEGVRIPVGSSKNMMLIATKNKDYWPCITDIHVLIATFILAFFSI
jgi:hypothetical protein